MENKFSFLLYITIKGLETELSEVLQMKIALFFLIRKMIYSVENSSKKEVKEESKIKLDEVARVMRLMEAIFESAEKQEVLLFE